MLWVGENSVAARLKLLSGAFIPAELEVAFAETALEAQLVAELLGGFGREAAAAEIAELTGLPFVTAPNKFTVQGAHDALVQLSGTLRTLAVSLYKIANDIRLMSCGPRAGFAELAIPENEPGSSIMPGKVNPTQAEALTMIAVQVMANDLAVGFGGAGAYLEMNVYKPLIIFNITHSITILTDGWTNFRKFLVEGTKPNVKKIKEYVDNSLMLVTALSPVIGYDRASQIAHYAMQNDVTEISPPSAISLKFRPLSIHFASALLESGRKMLNKNKDGAASHVKKPPLPSLGKMVGYAACHWLWCHCWPLCVLSHLVSAGEPL